ncbi:S8 family serine peptidase [Pseudomonas schmalbachii]|uniref:S8 family serine peptidase n=1 Tax=Pseudomonas schmalbachii TaxID=2816993 RepID=A0ABS3TM87_9PSED|nr:S8 family serine peptidase [Pseudomonas schmalbachii]MBO3274508.1 S8 family serine peptidase [Pseudomonas schmalbachii]
MPSNLTEFSMEQHAGRFIVTFCEGGKAQALSFLKKTTGVGKAQLMSSRDFGFAGVDVAQAGWDGGVLFEHLGVAVVQLDGSQASHLLRDMEKTSSILAVEPEGMMYALDEPEGPSLEYLRGFRDAANALYDLALRRQGSAIAALFDDTATDTWGLQATGVLASRYSGAGIKVAVLDTGLDLQHPDFIDRTVVAKSFVPGAATVQDGHGHGTHCAGTACGPRATADDGRRYGVAHGAELHVGKVLADDGSGADTGILAAIDWAIANHCQVVSMSLGSDQPTTSVAYETVGQRALNAGTLLIAAAGNNARRSAGNPGFVGRPANSRSFMAVGAIDHDLHIADFSAQDSVLAPGTAVDIAAPGVDVYSSWPMPARTRIISGTSMATPHVAGIAALWAEATGARGAALWQRLIANARTLPLPVVDVGRGLVQAP